MKQLFSAFCIILLLFTSMTSLAHGATSTKQKVTSLNVSAALSKDKKSVNVTFTGLENAKKLNFTLIYTTNGRQEGAGGSITPKKGEKTITRNLLLGTCSKKVCTYHTKIKNMKLEVSGKLTNGKNYTKSITIKY